MPKPKRWTIIEHPSRYEEVTDTLIFHITARTEFFPNTLHIDYEVPVGRPFEGLMHTIADRRARAIQQLARGIEAVA